MADNNHSRRLFLGCFIGLVATAFGFAVRGAVLKDWGVQFSLSEEQKGVIQGVGLYPFAISIILLSLIVEPNPQRVWANDLKRYNSVDVVRHAPRPFSRRSAHTSAPCCSRYPQYTRSPGSRRTRRAGG